MPEVKEKTPETTSPILINLDRGLSDLPVEVLQDILLHLDGKTSVVCKRVCKAWKDHINYLEQKKTYWYDKCRREIPSWVQFDLLDNIYPGHWAKQNSVDWQVIYKCWYNWENLKDYTVRVKKTASDFQGITSVKISGQWALFSTCEFEGKLIAQNLITGSNSELFAGGREILNIELVNSDKPYASNVRPRKSLDAIFDTLGHNEIWLEMRNNYVQIGKTYIHNLDRYHQKIRHSYGYQVRLLNNGQQARSILNFNKICDKVKGPEVMEVELPRHYSGIMDFYQQKVALINQPSHNNDTLKLRIDTLNVDKRTQSVSATPEDLMVMEWITDSTKVCPWQASLFVIHTITRVVVFHMNCRTMQQETSVRRGVITAVLFYANHLFLGTDRGQLMIYKCQTPADCLSIQIYDTEPFFVVDMGLIRIVQIAVAEPPHHKGKRPMIVCASPEEVYVITFPV